ncbi:EamA family transporter [Kribbella solani]|uniref:Drug/metabolite transporter (DMT)-like permease n=1 Tax=Kribbella solani TaxID=236067 RepID=A0A841DFA8_9ACTN|nr:drug/metabolite transporter (DMT)-like permease [Kribbella solani]
MGRLFCLFSAAAFGVMAVFGKLAYDAGVSVDALLLVRFGVAGALLLTIALARGALRGLPRRAVLTGIGMGAIGYAAQSALYFSALARIDASLVALILYLYPILVMGTAILLRRETASRRRVLALATALLGIGLVLSGALGARFDLQGVLLALGAPIVYTAYILVGDSLKLPPLALTALVCTGAFGTYVLLSFVRGGTSFGFAPIGWVWLLGVALISTVAAILLFFAGMARVGPSVTSILSIFEPVVTVVAATVVFGEHLTGPQWLGGALVLSAVLIVSVRTTAATRRRASGGSPTPPRRTPQPAVPSRSGPAGDY